jgi:cell division protease FtsH
VQRDDSAAHHEAGTGTHQARSCVQVKLLVERAYRRAKDLVQSNIDILHKVAAILMEKENVDGDEFNRIVQESQARRYLKADAPGVAIPYQA